MQNVGLDAKEARFIERQRFRFSAKHECVNQFPYSLPGFAVGQSLLPGSHEKGPSPTLVRNSTNTNGET